MKVKIVDIKKKITIIKKKIIKLVKEVKTAPVDKREVIVRKINVFKKTIKVFKKQIKETKVTIKTISNPAPVVIIRPAPKDVTVVVGKTCKKYRLTAKALLKKYQDCSAQCALSKSACIAKQEQGLKIGCVTVCDRGCAKLHKSYKDYVNKTKRCNKYTNILVRPNFIPRPKPATLSKTTIEVIKTFKKKVDTYIKKVTDIRTEIKKLDVTLKTTTDVVEKEKIVNKITILKKTIKRVTKKIVSIKKTIVRISRPRPVDPTPGPIFVKPLPSIKRRVVIKEFKKIVDIKKVKIVEITKKINVVRKEIKILKTKLVDI